MLSELESEQRANVHSLLVLSRGNAVCRCAAPGYDGQIPHLSHSMSKTVTGIAIGLLITEGKITLDQPVGPLFSEYKVTDKRLRALTVRHLLTMQSGVKFNEAGVVTDAEWTKTFFSSPLSDAPGTAFSYNSMNSYILARIVHRVSGQSLVDYLMPRLFSPLHIDRPLWQIGPEGVECGGWGLYLSDESWAKLGLMLCCKGRFEDKTVLDPAFVSEMTRAHVKTPAHLGDFDYGLHIWAGRESEEFLFNGMLGQNVWCNPKNGTVCMISAGNNELFSQSPALNIVRKNLLHASAPEGRIRFSARREYTAAQSAFFESRRWIRKKTAERGLFKALHLGKDKGFDPRFRAMLQTFIFRQNNNGILPVFVRTMENCFTGGIESLCFHRRGERLWMTAVEGGKPLTLEIGLKDYADTVLTFREEVYLVRAIGEAATDEDGRTVFKIELCFPELPNVRRIKILEAKNGCYCIHMDELPNQELGRAFIDSFPSKYAFVNEILERKLGTGYLHKLLKDVFSPSLLAIPAGKESTAVLLAEEEKKRAARRRSVSIITGIVARFFEQAPTSEESEGEEKSSPIGFFARFASMLKRPIAETKAAPTDADAEGAPLDADAEGAPLDADTEGASLDADTEGAPTDADAEGAPLDADAEGTPTDAEGAPLETADTEAHRAQIKKDPAEPAEANAENGSLADGAEDPADQN